MCGSPKQLVNCQNYTYVWVPEANCLRCIPCSTILPLRKNCGILKIILRCVLFDCWTIGPRRNNCSLHLHLLDLENCDSSDVKITLRCGSPKQVITSFSAFADLPKVFFWGKHKLVLFFPPTGEYKSCRSRKMLKNAPTLAIWIVDTAENGQL